MTLISKIDDTELYFYVIGWCCFLYYWM